MPKELDLIEATQIFQKYYRGLLARRYFQVSPLEEKYRKLSKTFVIGNDPVIHGLDKYREPYEKIALVGSSGMRSVLLACQLGNKHHIPKIIIIDHSSLVCAFWRGLRALISDDAKANTEEGFFMSLAIFLEMNRDLFADFEPDDLKEKELNPLVDYPSQDICDFFKNLFEKFGYSYVRAVIMHTSVLLQCWEDEGVFIVLRNIFDLFQIKKVFVYPSNIAACYLEEHAQLRVLANMEILDSTLAIHTNRCTRHQAPENVFLLELQESKFAHYTIFSKKCVYDAAGEQENLEKSSSREQMSQLCKKTKVK